MKYSLKKTLIKFAKMFLIYGVPVLLNEFTIKYPEIAALSVGGALHLLLDIAKHKLKLRLP